MAAWPEHFFALVWIAPLLVTAAVLSLSAIPSVFSEMAAGDWHRAAAAAMAALICGFFWEMWNYHSLAKWHYSIPRAHRFLLFEMPVAGYAGYLPFGLQCLMAGDLLAGIVERRRG